MFQIKNVSKSYNGEYALQNVSMTIGKGLNFIIGASGSGKTTLLKIISGMEKDFEGSVSYCDKDISALNSDEKGYFYNSIYGFVWQDFNLLEELTVTENILVPTYLKEDINMKAVKRILNELKLQELSDQKVKYLSGGQKQRVAIARELMKNPQVIIADEPTSALDEKTSKEVMSVLRTIAKNRMVIVVTHDTSLIQNNDNVYELDKGELVESAKVDNKKVQPVKMQNKYSLSLGDAFSIIKTDIKRNFGKFAISVISLMVAAVLLLTTFSGVINATGTESVDNLLDKYGESILDLSIASSFMNAAGTDGNDDNPSGEVNQDINGLYEKYASDKRVKHIISSQYYNDINVTVDGESYAIEGSGNVPVFKKMLAGKMPSNDKYEVVVPQNFVKDMGITNEEAIGKEIEFTATLYSKNVNTKAVISGVADNSFSTEFEGKMYDYSIDDSFFFSKTAENDLRKQAGKQNKPASFIIRANSPQDVISLKNELNKNGIVPLGQFEIIEDIVKLGTQTKEQSGSASVVIGFVAVVLVVAVFAISTIMKKREYAIYKVSGFANKHLLLTVFMQTVIQAISAVAVMLVTSPLINMATKAIFNVEIMSIKMLSIGVGLLLAVAIIAFVITCLLSITTKIETTLKAGDR